MTNQAPLMPVRYEFRGRLLPQVEVVTVFWGPQWEDDGPQWQGNNLGLTRLLNEFFGGITPELTAVLSRSIRGLTHGEDLSGGRLVGTAPWREPAEAQTDDVQVQRIVQKIATASDVWQPTPRTLYMVYLPPGTRISRTVMLSAETGARVTQRSCEQFCGYHDVVKVIGGIEVAYAVVAFPDCPGCVRPRERGGPITAEDVINALTAISSHEMINAITDPVYGEGVFDNHHGEICDLCWPQTIPFGNFQVARWFAPQSDDHPGGCI